MEVLRKYGAATTILFPLIDAGEQDFESTPVTFASGDTQISKDEGAFANTTNNPAHEGNGIYSLSLTATEMQAARVVITVVDQTATKAWEDQAIVISTYGSASGQHAFDLDTATQDVNVASVDNDAIAAAAIATDAIDADAIADNAIDAGAIATAAITNAKFAGNAIDAGVLAANIDAYQAKVWLIDDNSSSYDRYVVVWFRNAEPVTSGITSPTIQVIQVSDGADLVGSTAMTQIAATGMYRYDENTNRVSSGAAYIVKVEATIDASTRTWYQPVGRDS